MPETTLPEGFRVTVDTDSGRVWRRDGVGPVVIAKPYPIPGFSQAGWVVELINPDRVSVEVGIRHDELDALAASWCGMYAGSAVSA